MARLFAELTTFPSVAETRHPLLAGVSASALDVLKARATLVRLKEGALLFDERDGYSDFFLLQRGAVRMFSMATDGQQAGIEVLAAPALLSARDTQALGRRGAAMALEPVLAWQIPHAAMNEAMALSSELCRNLLNDTAARLRTTGVRVQAMAFYPAPKRLQHVLSVYARAFGLPVAEGVRIRIPLSQEDLAQDIGATRRSVVRAMKDLRDADVITRHDRHIVIRDLPRLEQGLDVSTPTLVHTSAPRPEAERELASMRSSSPVSIVRQLRS